jgi:hypothetical protein
MKLPSDGLPSSKMLGRSGQACQPAPVACRLRGSIPTHRGSILTRQGSILTPQGSILTRQGSIMTRQGSILTHQGSIMTHQGSILTRRGSIMTRQGSIPTPQGSIMTRQGSIPTHQGSIPTRRESSLPRRAPRSVGKQGASIAGARWANCRGRSIHGSVRAWVDRGRPQGQRLHRAAAATAIRARFALAARPGYFSMTWRASRQSAAGCAARSRV